MKILTLSNCPLVESQGSGYVILNYCRGLQERGHEVDLIGPDDLELLPRVKKGRVYRFAIGMLLEAHRRLRRKHYDIVEFYGGEAWLATLWLAQWRQRRFLIVAHSNGIEPHATHVLRSNGINNSVDGRPRRWYQIDTTFLMRYAFTSADAVVTVSDYDRNFVIDEKYKSDSQVIALDNPLPNSFLNRPLKLDRAPVILYCGTLIARKNIHTLFADMVRVLREFPAATLKLVGVGTDFNASAVFPHDLLCRVIVTPFESSKELIQKHYVEASIAVVPSFYESFGLVISEAMACGCSVVAARTGFAAGLTHLHQAWLMDNPQSPQIYEGVSALLRDDSLRRKIAMEGHQRVQDLNWSRAVIHLERTYEEWLTHAQVKHVSVAQSQITRTLEKK